MGELGWIGLVRIRNKTGRPYSSAPQNTQNSDVQGTSAEKQWAGIPGEGTYYSLGSSEFVVSNYSYTWQKILTGAIDCKNAVNFFIGTDYGKTQTSESIETSWIDLGTITKHTRVVRHLSPPLKPKSVLPECCRPRWDVVFPRENRIVATTTLNCRASKGTEVSW